MSKRIYQFYGTPAFLIGTQSEDCNVVKATKVVVGGASVDALKSALDELLRAGANVTPSEKNFSLADPFHQETGH